MAKKIYNRIQDHIRELIRSRQLLPGQSLPSERSLGQVFKVSQNPVRHAMDQLIDEGILHRVPGKGTFVRPDSAKTVKTNKIGVLYCFPNHDFLDSSFYAAIVAGINDQAQQEERRLLLSSFIHNGKSDPERVIKEMENDVDGFIVVDPVYPAIPGLEKAAAATEKPLVALSFERTIKGVDQVNFDGHEDTAKMVRFLYKQGHRRIAMMIYTSDFFGGSNNPNYQHRISGYRDTMEELGLDHRPLFFMQKNIHDGATLKKLLAVAERPTVIITGHDMHARFVYGQLHGLGLKIPEDVAVVGYDGTPEGAMLHPALTTVGCPLKEMGRTAVRKILERCAAGTKGLPAKTTLPSEIWIKGSHQLKK